MKYIFLFLFPFSYLCSLLNEEQCAVLDVFCKYMLKHHELGYVLEGSKPVCATGYEKIDETYPGTSLHESGVNHYHAFKVLNHLNKSKNAKYLLSSSDQADNGNLVETIFINVQSFKEEFSQNKALFKYILGPFVDTDILLNALSRRDVGFIETLRNDRVLIGILLGFKTDNAIYGSRLENIQDMLFTVNPPLRTCNIDSLDYYHPVKDMLLLSPEQISYSNKSHQLSLGMSNLDEELKALYSSMDISSLKLCESPPFLFGKIKDRQENQILIAELEEQQLKIANYPPEEILPSFMKHFGIEEGIPINPSYNTFQFELSEEEKKRINLVIARKIWTLIQNETPCFQESFIQIFSHQKVEEEPSICCHYEVIKKRLSILEKLNTCEKLLKELAKEGDIISIIEEKLFYKLLKKGSGLQLQNQPKVLVHYQLFSQDNQIICDTRRENHPKPLNLEEAIVGLALGMQGMQIGEVRDIYIHPDYGYGLYTTFPKMFIKANVELIDILADSSATTEIKPFSFEVRKDLIIDNENFKKLSIQQGFYTGKQFREHYLKSKLCSIEEIAKYLQLLFKGESFPTFSKTATADEDLIYRVHWNIYNRPEKPKTQMKN